MVQTVKESNETASEAMVPAQSATESHYTANEYLVMVPSAK